MSFSGQVIWHWSAIGPRRRCYWIEMDGVCVDTEHGYKYYGMPKKKFALVDV